MISIPGALWGDVFVAGNGVIGCAYDQGKNVIIEFFRSNEVFTGDRKVLDFSEQVLFVRADMNGIGEILVMGQGNESGQFLSRSVNGSFTPVSRPTYGTHACDLAPTYDGFDYLVQVSTTEYYDSFFKAHKSIPAEIRGTSNGIIQMLHGQPVWADLARASIPQMLYPFNQDSVFIGEGAADPPHVEALEDGVSKNIYNGYAARPRACYDLTNNIFAVAARSEGGVNFHFFSRPLPNLNVEVPPVIPPVEPPVIPPVEPPVVEPPDPEEPEEMACTPVVPQQDVVARSTEAIRQFCQTYEFNGSKPYAADEIHENGLFLSDGLLYFMMSDTGLWAKILMNPDDKRPWDEKRQAADNALFNYMRGRVGDTPKSTAPGGTLSGDVNV